MERPKILIVEDENIVAEDTKDILQRFDYSVIDIVSSGTKAIQRTAELHPDLVLMDISLKEEMDGIQAAEQIRDRFDIPVIYITAYTDKDTLQRAKVSEAYGYLVKPFKERELLSVIEMTLYKHKMDKRLRESEQWLSTLLKSIGDAVIATDNKGIVTFMNPVAEALTGRRKEDARDKDLKEIFKIINEKTRKPAVNPVSRVLKEGKVSGLANDTILISKNGKEIPIDDTASPILDDNGDIKGVVLIFRDITGRKRAEQELIDYRNLLEELVERRTAELEKKNAQLQKEIVEHKRSEDERIRLATAIEQAAESVVITDTKGNIQYVNPAFERISGYTREDAFGQNARILKSAQHNETFYKQMWETITRGKVWSGHLINRTKAGTFCELDATISPILDNTGVIINYVSVRRDVTNEMMLEKQLRQAQKMEAIGTLAGGIAHDFNNILGIILGYTEMVISDLSEETETQRRLAEVLKAAQRAKDLVRQILAFSRQREQELMPLKISPIVREAIKLLRASLPATIEIRQKVDVKLDTVLADPTQIHQVLMNLGTNAAHAMREKGGVLDINLINVDIDADNSALYPDLHKSPYLRLTVSDTGHGMDWSVMDRIFEPYFTTKGKGEGTGLGLAVVHGIVKNFGGTIIVNSEPGKGTTFQIFLSRIEGKASVNDGTTMEIIAGNERILLVDDEPVLAKMEQEMLEKIGYEVAALTSSLEALEVFRRKPNQFDLVITDQTMPHLTGIELAEALIGIRSDIPIILCSGFSELISGEQSRNIGIREFVMKPVIAREIARTIRKVLDG